MNIHKELAELKSQYLLGVISRKQYLIKLDEMLDEVLNEIDREIINNHKDLDV